MTAATGELAAWEADARRHGSLPSADAGNVTDPDYLIAALRYSREVAAAYAAEYRADPDPEQARWAATAELAVLKQQIDRFIRDLRPLGTAGNEMLEVLRSLHPHLHWRACAGGLFGTEGYTSEAEGAAERAAQHLRLTLQPDDGLGRKWQGQVETWEVAVWGK